MSQFQVLLYYHFTHIENPQEFGEKHLTLCESLELRGRILIAEEGINGTVSGSIDACEKYQESLLEDSRFDGIEFKVEPTDGHVFKSLKVKVREEIISLGAPLQQRVEVGTAPRLSPSEWRAMLDQKDVVVLDGRNGYESELGRFDKAICPPVQNFREFPEWMLNNREKFENKVILTYCTGGIRCEKLSAWMLENGFQNVFQLHGGIVKYGQDPQTQGEGFSGVNVVFDERVITSAGNRSQVDTVCRECGKVTSNYVNCANVECNVRMVQCPACEVEKDRCCSDECRVAPRLRLKGRKWYESARRID